MFVVYLFFFLFVRNTLYHVHSVGSGQAFEVLSLFQNSDSGPFDSELDIRTMNYSIKHNNIEKNKRKKE